MTKSLVSSSQVTKTVRSNSDELLSVTTLTLIRLCKLKYTFQIILVFIFFNFRIFFFKIKKTMQMNIILIINN